MYAKNTSPRGYVQHPMICVSSTPTLCFACLLTYMCGLKRSFAMFSDSLGFGSHHADESKWYTEGVAGVKLRRPCGSVVVGSATKNQRRPD
jgi:hypothetical protein